MALPSTLRSTLSELKARALLTWYQQRYDTLAPASYRAEDFARVADEACALLGQVRRQLPPLPAEALQSMWAEALADLGGVLARPLPEDFLSIPAIRDAMVRRGWTRNQSTELAYLRRQTAFFADIAARFRDSRVGGPHLECKELGCSSSALGYLYYLARLRVLRGRFGLAGLPDDVVELGGGFGGFCRAYQWARPTERYTIVDLPEFSAVQYLFLKLSLPGTKVTFVTSLDQEIPADGIRLVPVQIPLARPTAVNAGLFTSHFALTEAGQAVRALVYRTAFFGAREVFYIGQQGARWGVSVDPEVLEAMSAERGWRRTVSPFYMKDCIEILGVRS
jgi:hypothetical protein